MSLKNKIVIITGSTRGIGLAIAKTFAEAGATLIISSRNQEKTTEIANTLMSDYNIQSLGIACNVSSLESCKELISKCIETYGKIDVLINNAGITDDNLLLRMSEDQWNNVIQTNLNSVFYMTKTVSKYMLKQKSGKIINITSVVGLMGNAGQANYAAAKAGIIGLTKSIAKELGSKGIICNAIAPGFIDTDMIDSLPKEYISNIINNIPLKRLGTVKDVSDLTLFLASEKSNYITGQTLSVDGGMNM